MTSDLNELKFKRLFELYSQPVTLFFVNRGFSLQDAQDLTQETFVGVYNGLGQFRNESGIDTWLFKIASNVWRNALRSRSADKRMGQEVSLEAIQSEGLGHLRVKNAAPLDELVAYEFRSRVRVAVTKLPPKMQRCLLLRIDRQLKYREIAELMQISIDTVKSLLFQARDRMRELLADERAGASVTESNTRPLKVEPEATFVSPSTGTVKAKGDAREIHIMVKGSRIPLSELLRLYQRHRSMRRVGEKLGCSAVWVSKLIKKIPPERWTAELRRTGFRQPQRSNTPRLTFRVTRLEHAGLKHYAKEQGAPLVETATRLVREALDLNQQPLRTKGRRESTVELRLGPELRERIQKAARRHGVSFTVYTRSLLLSRIPDLYNEENSPLFR